MNPHRVTATILLATFLTACGPTELPVGREAHTVAMGTVDDGAPAPDAGIPWRPKKLARALLDTRLDLSSAIRRWRAGGARVRTPEARRALLEGLYEQRIFRRLIAHPKLDRRVRRHLPKWLARKAATTIRAGRGLYRLVRPVKPSRKWKTAHAEAPNRLRRYYRAGRRRYRVPWSILAAVNFVESKFGRLLGPSTSGARGPMQFLPSTWDAYGHGDIMDPHDSIVAAARYLHANGAPRRMRSALYAYNHSTAYVNAVLTYAHQMRRKSTNYYAYYTWQAFVLTTKGVVQLTGPGS